VGRAKPEIMWRMPCDADVGLGGKEVELGGGHDRGVG
jgi:hypothetical protein